MTTAENKDNFTTKLKEVLLEALFQKKLVTTAEKEAAKQKILSSK